MRFHKYHALGNDYLVLDDLSSFLLSEPAIRRVCDRHYGVGSDGILVLGTPSSGTDFTLRILNPDGSEAEKSGNGLRILAKYLWHQRRVTDQPFTVSTRGGVVRCQVRDEGRLVFVEMGTASFLSTAVPVAGPAREVVDEALTVDDVALRMTAVNVGNPHCVVTGPVPSRELAERIGPRLEHLPIFPNRINVQFMAPIDRHRIRLQIWERGAGYTLASGSSSCAAAAASVRLKLCESPVTVEMPGGELVIGVDPGYGLTMVGPAEKIAEGETAPELFADLA